ncbi:MAG TPA: hypothetical protein VJJ82_02450 [Candidatus Nanoarchaeia archaeon]|nr:hypothetical protein [Candidatus Nanoarchaeia archaeon]
MKRKSFMTMSLLIRRTPMKVVKIIPPDKNFMEDMRKLLGNYKMENEDRPPLFLFAISEQFIADKPHYLINMENTGIPDDAIICMMESWLRAIKDHYFENIRSGMKF